MSLIVFYPFIFLARQSMASDSERLKACYESIVQHNSNNIEAVHYLAVWHFERQSFNEVKL
ncbi:hypothetical protein EON65_46265 [archaeon]|nr:MAG: hypothetical protein EON65_46265 [archaeon]